MAAHEADPWHSRTWDAPGELRGINLRSWLVLQLADSSGSLTVAQLVDRLAVSDLSVNARASKTISDALRWEVRRGRVVRLARGRYALGRLARTARHRMRRRLIACRARAQHAGGPDLLSVRVPPTSDRPVGVGGDLERLGFDPVVAPKRNTGVLRASDHPISADRPPP